jgi:hypothetical protein
MPGNAFWRGGNHRFGWFDEHFEIMLWKLFRRVNEIYFSAAAKIALAGPYTLPNPDCTRKSNI